jgi:hypothetical protein
MKNGLRCATALIVLLSVAGCGGPTRTAGTRGVPTKDLAVFSVLQLPPDAPVQIRTVWFNAASPEYEVGDGRDFYLLPGGHTASFNLTVRIPGTTGLFASLYVPEGALNAPGPRNAPLGTLAAGKTYEVVPRAEDFDQMLSGGRLPEVREKRE